MNIYIIKPCALVIVSAFAVAGCSVAQLEARLEANPQCKEIVNPKTGALMPCPGSEKAFYKEVGLTPAKPVPAFNSSTGSPAIKGGTTPSNPTPSVGVTAAASSTPKLIPAPADCKPQIHKKTGGTLPCPAPD